MPLVSVCIPAHNEAATLAAVLRRVRCDVGPDVQVLVVDDGSTDGTADIARREGAQVVLAAASPGRPVGKGRAMAAGLPEATGDVVVFTDADVIEIDPRAATKLVAALLSDPALVMAKARYVRQLHGQPGEGGRVNALLARPLLQRFFPELGHLEQPLAGDYAIRRSALSGVVLEPGYGVEMGLLLDLAARYGAHSITQVDLGTLRHRNRPLHQLTGHAEAILHTVMDRWVPSDMTLAG